MYGQDFQQSIYQSGIVANPVFPCSRWCLIIWFLSSDGFRRSRPPSARLFSTPRLNHQSSIINHHMVLTHEISPDTLSTAIGSGFHHGPFFLRLSFPTLTNGTYWICLIQKLSKALEPIMYVCRFVCKFVCVYVCLYLCIYVSMYLCRLYICTHCMYLCIYGHHTQHSMDQAGKVANPARGLC